MRKKVSLAFCALALAVGLSVAPVAAASDADESVSVSSVSLCQSSVCTDTLMVDEQYTDDTGDHERMTAVATVSDAQQMIRDLQADLTIDLAWQGFYVATATNGADRWTYADKDDTTAIQGAIALATDAGATGQIDVVVQAQ